MSDKVTARPRLVINKPKKWNIEKSKRKKDMLQVAGAREGTITPPHPKSPGPTLGVSTFTPVASTLCLTGIFIEVPTLHTCRST